MMSLGHGRAQVQKAELGGTRDGKLLGYKLSVIQDSGAYPDVRGVPPDDRRA